MGRFEELGTALDLLFNKIINRNFNKADELIQKTEQKIDDLKQEVDTIVAHTGDGTKDTELILARGNAPTLGGRLDATEAQLAEKAPQTEIDRIGAELVVKANQADLLVERARIDGFTSLTEGSTTGDAELNDGKVAVDGTIYPNIGGAIRAQVREKMSVIDGIISRKKTVNYVIIESVSYGYFYDSVTGKKASASPSWWAHPVISIIPNKSYRKTACAVALYDANRNLISYILYTTTNFTTPSNAAYVGICANTDVNSAGLYEADKYKGVYVRGENLLASSQIQDFNSAVVNVVGNEFIERTVGKNLYDKNGQGITLVKGGYVEYNTGVVLANVNQQYGIIFVTPGETLAISTTDNVHIAFFNSEIVNSTTYISGVLNLGTVTPPAGAVVMTVSCRQDVADQMQVEIGSKSTDYEPYQYGLGTNNINNGAITPEKLSPDLASSIRKKEVHVGGGRGYSSILTAIKDNPGKNVTFIIHTGLYDLVAEYEGYYGSNYFVDYAGYATSDHFDKGLYLDDGVSMIGYGNVEIVFNYTGGNVNVHRWFAPINTSQNNVFDNITVTIGNEISRYGIHDDFAYAPGTNIFRNCTFKGKSFLDTFMGCGFGKSNTYIIENCRFKGVGGINIAYHNNVAAGAKNKLIIKDCYCDGAIRGAQYGASSEISEMIVSGCKATSISVVMTDDTGNNKANIELVEWNNT